MVVPVRAKGGREIDGRIDPKSGPLSGDELVDIAEALANPYRLKIIALLAGRQVHVSRLAREMKISRPLLYMHLKRLEKAGLVTSRMEISDYGKAMKFYRVVPFALHLTPENIAAAAQTLTTRQSGGSEKDEKGDDPE